MNNVGEGFGCADNEGDWGRVAKFCEISHNKRTSCAKFAAASKAPFPVLIIFMSSEFSLEDLLDSVADAVSALVLFANEVSTDRKKLTNLQEGVKMVQSATAFFTSDAGRTIKMWRDFGNERTWSSIWG